MNTHPSTASRKSSSPAANHSASDQTAQVPTDEALFHEIVHEQSETALEELYTRYRLLLRSVIMRIIHDDAEAEDILQDVFVQVWNQGHQFSPEKGRVLGWLIILARRRTVDRLRKRGAYQRASDRYEAEYKLSPENNCEENRVVDREVCSNDLRELMCRLMEKLPPNQEEVIKLTFFNDLSQREIAEHLHMPLGTVKTRIELGLRKLGNALRPVREKVV